MCEAEYDNRPFFIANGQLRNVHAGYKLFSFGLWG